MEPWKRLVGEPLEAYEAFIDCLLGDEAATEAIEQRWGAEQIQEWRLTYAWAERSARFAARRDREIRAIQSQSHSQEVVAYIQAQKSLAGEIDSVSQALLGRANEVLEASHDEDLTLGQAISMIRLVSELSRLSNDIKGRVLGVNQLLKTRLRPRETSARHQ